MTQDQQVALEKTGWVIVCESPLEIEFTHPDYPQDGVIGFASGVAARELLEKLLAELE